VIPAIISGEKTATMVLPYLNSDTRLFMGTDYVQLLNARFIIIIEDELDILNTFCIEF